MDSFELEDEDPYYPQSIPLYLSRWMSRANPKTLLRQMILPGSHKSNSNRIAKPIYAVPFTKCQTDSVTEQLCRGIRYLDFRYGRISKKGEAALRKQRLGEQEMMEQMIVDSHGMCRGTLQIEDFSVWFVG